MTARLKRSGAALIALWASTVGLAVAQTHPIDSAIRTGDSAWTAGQFPKAREAYTRVLAIDSLGSSRSVYRLAVLRSWDGDLKEALPLFALYVRLEPRDEEGRLALARAYAWSGNTAHAVAIYDSILARDATYREAALGAARALTWAGRSRQALARYDKWLIRNPRDIEAGLARARSLAWAGRLQESERAYAALGKGGENLESQKGIALVAAWRGDLSRSERIWRELSTKAPKDAEVWVGLAQVLRWSGRSEAARTALKRAQLADPANPDAREQMRWVNADLGWTLEPGGSALWDSDRNESEVVSLATSMRPASRTRFTATGSFRDARLAATRGRSATGRASLQVHGGNFLTLTGELGAVRTSVVHAIPKNERTFTIGSARTTLRISSGFSVGGGVTRSVFDETAALIVSGITVTSYAGEAKLSLLPRVDLAAGGEVADLTGGSGPNQRRAGFAALSWRVRRLFSLSLTGRGFGYDESPHDGYFAPSRFLLGELGTRIGTGRELGWAAELSGGVGIQQVRFDDPGEVRGTQRVGASLAYRPRPGVEFAFAYAFSNVANTTGTVTGGGSVYHANTLQLSTRLTW
jgi:tetratricopeptide (TPR) repeat protein